MRQKYAANSENPSQIIRTRIPHPARTSHPNCIHSDIFLISSFSHSILILVVHSSTSQICSLNFIKIISSGKVLSELRPLHCCQVRNALTAMKSPGNQKIQCIWQRWSVVAFPLPAKNDSHSVPFGSFLRAVSSIPDFANALREVSGPHPKTPTRPVFHHPPRI